jgi:two-component system, OmpR family, sensor kinase
MTVRLPLAVKIPLVVSVFMAAVAIFVSERVLTRLEEAQTRHLNDLATVYLDGLASALAEPVVREDVWETFDILDRARQTHAGMKPTETVVANSDGRVLASSDPRTVPPRSALPAKYLAGEASTPAVVARDGDEAAVARRDLSTGGRVVGSVHAAFDIAPLIVERRSVLFALIATNALLTLAFATAAWLTVTRMLRPVRVIKAHLQAAAEHRGEPIPGHVVAQAPGEFRPLFQSFNDMAEAVRERETLAKQLADEERLASLGRLASGMAHEINNPLGGLFNAIDTLKEHGGRPEVRRRTIELIERGLRGIRDVVRTTLVTYRTDPDASVLKATDIDDLKLLIEPEIRRKGLSLEWTNDDYADVAVSPSLVRQVILNLLLNACQAAPEHGEVSLTAGIQGPWFVVTVGDSGPGLPDAARDVLLSTEDRVPGSSGLGLWMVRRLMNEAGGTVAIAEGTLQGTTIRITIPLKQEALADVA